MNITTLLKQIESYGHSKERGVCHHFFEYGRHQCIVVSKIFQSFPLSPQYADGAVQHECQCPYGVVSKHTVFIHAVRRATRLSKIATVQLCCSLKYVKILACINPTVDYKLNTVSPV